MNTLCLTIKTMHHSDGCDIHSGKGIICINPSYHERHSDPSSLEHVYPPLVSIFSFVCPQVFWKLYRDLSDWEKVIKNIERGEQKIQRQQDIMNAVAAKLERYKNPWQELKVITGRGE